jgi:hypothetical protein
MTPATSHRVAVGGKMIGASNHDTTKRGSELNGN